MTKSTRAGRWLAVQVLFLAGACGAVSCDVGSRDGADVASAAPVGAAAEAVKGSGRRHNVESDVTPGHKAHILFDDVTQAQYQAEQQAIGLAVTNTNMVYPPTGGGPVMRNPTNYVIFWQPPGRNAFPAGYIAAVEKYFNDVGGTPFYDIVTQYNDTTGLPVPNATSLGAPAFVDTTTAPPSGNNGTTAQPLTDGDIQAEVTHALAANPAWARPSNNVEYFVFTPFDVDECFNSTNCFAITGGLNGTFCAYHSSFNTNTIYAYMPFASNGACYGAPATFPNGNVVDIVLGTTSHEMIESNTDPLGNAWTGTGGGDDEIGDKCAYTYGFVEPDGTNIVLNGDRYQIQEEWSNDITGCAKRYGPTPSVSAPASLAFGEVPAGGSATLDLVIQNLAGGDLDILGVRLGAGSSPYFSLVNVPPTAATLHPSEGLKVTVRFAPPANAAFATPTGSVIVDTDDPAQTTYTTSLTGSVGVRPTALCSNRTASTDAHLCSAAVVSVDNGSFDSDGEGLSLSQSPAGPYTLGTTNVTLTVTDTGADQQVASCTAAVTVRDTEAPIISCPAPQSVPCTSAGGASVSLTPTAGDNCPGVTASCSPSSGSTFGFGSTPVTCTATDASGNTTSCSTSVTVTDVPPVIQSVVASPNILMPPNKKLQGVNILVQETDVCDPSPTCSITTVTAANQSVASGVDYVITGPLSLKLRASGNTGHPLTYIVTVKCSDHHGGSTTAQTTVQAPI